MQGRSLVPLLKGQNPQPWRDAIYYHYFEYPGYHMVARHRGVRTDRFKLIHFYQFGEWELYDLDADPQEQRSQYDNPIYAKQVSALKQRLEELRVKYADGTDIRRVDPCGPRLIGKARRSVGYPRSYERR